MKRTLSLIISLVLVAMLVLSGCSSNVKTENDEALDGSVIATVENVDITQADFNFIYRMLFNEMSQYAQYYGDQWLSQPIDEEGTTVEAYLKDSAMKQLTQLVSASILAEEYDVDLDNLSDVTEKSKEDVVANYGGKEGYIEFLKDCRTTDKAIMTYLNRAETYSRLYEKLTAEGEKAYISTDELTKEFAQNYMTVRHILVSTQEQTGEDGSVIPARSDAEAKAIVDEVLKKIAAGEDFNELIEKYDEDPGMEPGKFYTFTSGQMVPEFEEASKNLKVGEYTKEAVKTDYGYHIIKKYEIDTADQNFTTFKQQKTDEKVNEIVEKKIESLKVSKKDSDIDKYVKEWLEVLKKDLKEAMEAQQKAMETQQNAAE